MNKIKILLVCLSLITLIGCEKTKYDGIKLKKVISDVIKNPECVFYDKETETLFISNVNGGTLEMNGDGFISQLNINGEFINEKLILNLNAPKGIYVKDGLIYITDINRLIIYDLLKKGRENIFVFENAESLNDIVVDDNGRIFISDFHANKLFLVNEEKISFLSIKKPNGLYIHDNFIYVGTFQESTNGHIYRSNLNNKQIVFESFLTDFGFCDGLYIDDEFIVISDFNSSIKKIDIENKQVVSSVVSKKGINYGDFYYNSEIIISPSMKNSQIHFLEFTN
ncbi:MAG: hypothetical protein CMC04_05975 [Flavobacteriaceae bacterium]|nr:hypothetical protein [Flavobacteriaceae bacterium]|tara:strand:+ start:12963 stop:13808 length:846 start_codon:yes stop_codon:yes gene_type:complete